MPNWCHNELTITGDRQQLRLFLDYGIDFDRAVPYPETFRQMDEAADRWEKQHPGESWVNSPKDGYNSGGHDWCVEHWGTTWKVSSEQQKPVSVTEDCLKYEFHTAWSSPLPVVVAWSIKFPGLKFRVSWGEWAGGFEGIYVIKGGEELENTSGPWNVGF